MNWLWQGSPPSAFHRDKEPDYLLQLKLKQSKPMPSEQESELKTTHAEGDTRRAESRSEMVFCLAMYIYPPVAMAFKFVMISVFLSSFHKVSRQKAPKEMGL